MFPSFYQLQWCLKEMSPYQTSPPGLEPLFLRTSDREAAHTALKKKIKHYTFNHNVIILNLISPFVSILSQYTYNYHSCIFSSFIFMSWIKKTKKVPHPVLQSTFSSSSSQQHESCLVCKQTVWFVVSSGFPPWRQQSAAPLFIIL